MIENQASPPARAEGPVLTPLQRGLESIVRAEHADPHSVLGPHYIDGEPGRVVVRAFIPRASRVWLRLEGAAEWIPAEKIHAAGIYAAALPGSR